MAIKQGGLGRKMAAVTEEYQKYVLDDMKNYVGLNIPVRAGIIERIIKRKAKTEVLHANPEDEFSMPEIGPNYEIVGNYAGQFKRALDTDQKLMEEPLMVEKMSTGGYMLLNGHHRWMAAMRIGVNKVPIQIVNVTPEEEIFKLVKKSARKKCVSFDLDEVLLTDGSLYPYDRKLIFPFTKLYKRSLRKNAGVLINELKQLGYDVWIYTGKFYSTEYITLLLKLHKTGVDGIVNGLGKKNNSNLKRIFSENYEQSVHIDNESILCVDTRTKDYDSIDITSDGSNWAAEVMKQMKKISMDELKE